MVKSLAPSLDRIFAALADPTRRALLARLDERAGVTVSELARPLPISLPAVMKHLDVLAEAGLIARRKRGRTVECELTAGPMGQAMEWLDRYQRFWSQQLDRLAALVKEDSCPPTSPASPSAAGSTPRPPRSSPRGRNRRN